MVNKYLILVIPTLSLKQPRFICIEKKRLVDGHRKNHHKRKGHTVLATGPTTSKLNKANNSDTKNASNNGDNWSAAKPDAAVETSAMQ